MGGIYQDNRERNSTYMLERYHRVMAELKAELGGVCSVEGCGVTDGLEFDHIDPTTKSFNIADAANRMSREQLRDELAKCNLKCRKHHNEKTIAERGFQIVKDQDVHGTLSSYRYCKCDLCRKVKADYMREYKRKRKASR